MKNPFLSALLIFIVLTSCSTQKRIPQTAYDPAGVTNQVTASVSVASTTPPAPVSSPADASVTSRQEKVKVVAGEANQTLFTYNIIVGSFSVYDNAVNLKKRLIPEGYSPTLLQNEQGMYRVCISGYSEEATARSQIQTVKKRFPEFSDAWLLIAR